MTGFIHAMTRTTHLDRNALKAEPEKGLLCKRQKQNITIEKFQTL